MSAARVRPTLRTLERVNELTNIGGVLLFTLIGGILRSCGDGAGLLRESQVDRRRPPKEGRGKRQSTGRRSEPFPLLPSRSE